jgi:hypothetical protein
MKSSLMKLNHVSTFSGEGQAESLIRKDSSLTKKWINGRLLSPTLPLRQMSNETDPHFKHGTVIRGLVIGLDLLETLGSSFDPRAGESF